MKLKRALTLDRKNTPLRKEKIKMSEKEISTSNNNIYTSNSKTYKNRNEFMNSQDKQYRISVVEYPEWVKNKDDKKQVIIQAQSGKLTWLRVNLKQKLKNEDTWKVFMSGNLQNVGYLPSKTYNKLTSKIYGIQADFIFLDFDNKDKDGNKLTNRYISYDVAHDILKNSNYNYILSTSHSHTVDHNKLHILIPTLKPIDSAELYKIYYSEIIKFFDGYAVDPAASSIANNKNGGNISTILVDVEFGKNDFHLDNVDLKAQKTLKKISKARTAKKISDIPSEVLNGYGKQVRNMYGMILDPGSSSKSLRFRRDENDKGPGVFNVPYSEEYNPNYIFDNRVNENNRRKEFETIFSLDDFAKRKNPKDVRADTQAKISKLIKRFLDPSINREKWHNYLITNEGLGKSTTVLSLGRQYNFIYATYTNENMNEKAAYLDSIGVKYRKILSVETILKDKGFNSLISDYNEYLSNEKKPSFSKYLETTSLSYSDRYKLLYEYKKNNDQIKYDSVILMTTAKLKIMLMCNHGDIWGDDKPIIFDEFVDSEWKRLASDNSQKLSKPSLTIPSTWGNETEYFYIYKQKSFFDVFSHKEKDKTIKTKDILVLTTERSLVEIYFWGSDFSEMTLELDELFELDKEFNMRRKDDSFLEWKLSADNVCYLLVHSTSKEILEDQASLFAKYNLKIISDGLKCSNYETLTHLGVKGMNNLSDENTVVFGTMKTEIVILEFYLNNKEYLTKWVEYNLGKKNLTEEEVIKESEPLIQKILIETQVSQSIGRNSGFRDNGKKCIVIIPVLHPRSFKRMSRWLIFNYISLNVYIMSFDKKTKKFSKVTTF
nr:hypothetical protein [uncultured Desulfobulbus sp.]